MDVVKDNYNATLFLTLWKGNRYHKWENLLMKYKV